MNTALLPTIKEQQTTSSNAANPTIGMDMRECLFHDTDPRSD